MASHSVSSEDAKRYVSNWLRRCLSKTGSYSLLLYLLWSICLGLWWYSGSVCRWIINHSSTRSQTKAAS